MTEEWRDIDGYVGTYQISSLGNVRNIKTNKNIKPQNNAYGYHMVSLCKNGKKRCHRISRLVAAAFLGHREGMWVNHINGVRKDDRIENLEWVTYRENICHGTKKKYKGAFKRDWGRFSSQINIGGKRTWLGTFDTELEAHNAYLEALKQAGIENRYARTEERGQ